MNRRRLLALAAFVAVAIGAPFAFGWGAIACALGFVLALAALWTVPRDDLPARRAAWAAAVGGGLALGIAFTVQVAAPNIVVAGQKAAGRQAVATLRTLMWAEDQMIRDHGRAGTLAEMSGVRPVGDAPLDVPLLRDPFRRVKAGATGGVVDFGGYTYQVWVLTPDGPRTDAAPDAPPVAIPRGAVDWLAYAWPTVPGTTGYRAFCINRYEDILELTAGPTYAGPATPPAWDACVTGPAPAGRLADGTGRDGGTWTRWRGKETRRSRSTPGAPGSAPP